MSVHKEISKHSQRQHQALQQFVALERKRETYIEEAISRCAQKQPFSVDQINAVTQQINDLAKKEIVPTRKYVTPEMVQEYVVKRMKEENYEADSN